MPFQIVRNDITRMRVDAIVNPTDRTLSGGGGLDGSIHRAAGPGLDKACRKLGGCELGEARLTRGYNLPCRYVIHTVGPVWRGGDAGEEAALRRCYKNSLALAADKRCASVALPLISSGTFGFPKDKALRISSEEIASFLDSHEITVYLVVFGQESVALGHELFEDIREYIDDHYSDAAEAMYRRGNRRREDTTGMPVGSASSSSFYEPKELRAETSVDYYVASPMPAQSMPQAPLPNAKKKAISLFPPLDATRVLKRRLDQMDESFQQSLLRLIDESGLSDVQCYKRANVDRKLFSKIRGDIHYRPRKTTALAFAIALELDIEETEELLRKAGYALSNSSKFDVIVRYFIECGRYDIFEINEALFYYDQALLGA